MQNIKPKRVIVAGADFYGYVEQIARGFAQIGCATTDYSYVYPSRSINFRTRLLYIRLRNAGVPHFYNAAWARLRQKFMQQLRRQEFDLLVMFYPELLTPDLIAEIRHRQPNAMLTTWLMDPLRTMPGVEPLLPFFDHIFTYNAADLPRLRQLTPNAHALVLGYDQTIYSPLATPSAATAPRHKLCFIGTHKPGRMEILENLCHHLALSANDVRMFTGRLSGYQRYRLWRYHKQIWHFQRTMLLAKDVNAHQACDLYHHSAISLNLHRVDVERGYNMRVFEIPGAGGFQLTNYVPGIEELFEEEKEIALFRSTDELHDKAAYYLAHPQEREKIAAQGQRRAAAHHTFPQRAATILSICGLDK